MLEQLREAIDNLDIPHACESLVEAIALRDRLDARIAEVVGAFEAARTLAFDPSTSTTAWLRANARMTKRSAQRLRTVAAKLRSLPLCARVYADGVLSGRADRGHHRRPRRRATRHLRHHEAELVPYLAPLTVAGVSRAMAARRHLPGHRPRRRCPLHLTRPAPRFRGDRLGRRLRTGPEPGECSTRVLALSTRRSRARRARAAPPRHVCLRSVLPGS